MTHPDPFSADPATTSRWIGDRQRLLRHEAEDALRAEILDPSGISIELREWQKGDSYHVEGWKPASDSVTLVS